MNILFDLDGTLTDSRRGIVGCIEHALTSLSCPIAPDAALHEYIGAPLRDVFVELLPAETHADRADEAIAAYRERYAVTGMFENEVFAGVPEVLQTLRARGNRLFVATAKPLYYAEQIVAHFGLHAFFEAVYGSELDGRLTNKGELIAHVMSTAGLSSVETIMVGDRYHDVEGAIANGLVPVGVLWGYGTREELHAAGARLIAAEPGELSDLLIPQSLTASC